MKIIYYKCSKCGYTWDEVVQDIYKDGNAKECPVCHSRESVITKKKISDEKGQ